MALAPSSQSTCVRPGKGPVNWPEEHNSPPGLCKSLWGSLGYSNIFISFWGQRSTPTIKNHFDRYSRIDLEHRPHRPPPTPTLVHPVLQHASARSQTVAPQAIFAQVQKTSKHLVNEPVSGSPHDEHTSLAGGSSSH